MSGARGRRGYLDWMRGLAVLIMIEGHLFDSWTGAAHRDTQPFGWALMLGGFGAPMFLFLAGVSVSLSAGARGRRSGDPQAAWRAVARRGLQVFGLAFLFRVQAWILGMGPARTLLTVDILNIMGPSIVAAAALWGAVTRTRGRLLVFAAAGAATALLTPLVRTTPWLAALPDPLEAYLRPVPGLTNFVFFPSLGFVFAGALIGALLDRTWTPAQERRANLLAGGGGVLLAAGAYGLSYLPSPFASSAFWTSSPAFFAIRAGVITTATALAYAWESRPGGTTKWSPLQQLGRNSLFIYWIHVEMVYGLISLPLHKALTLAQAIAAFLAFTGLMLACSLGRDYLAWWWQSRRGSPAVPVP